MAILLLYCVICHIHAYYGYPIVTVFYVIFTRFVTIPLSVCYMSFTRLLWLSRCHCAICHIHAYCGCPIVIVLYVIYTVIVGIPLLLCLSGGNYRSNQLSDEEGTQSFLSLSPGQYFLKPMMKEYKFEPASQMIDVAEGSTVNLAIKGTRVAFSCYGSVTSLNGEAEAGVLVEAVASPDDSSSGCTQLQEESKTEADGSFRIRGLQPSCTYIIRLQQEAGINQHIERTAPNVRKVKVDDSDIHDVHMIAFRRMNQMDLSGNVNTDHTFLPTLKVLMYRENNPDAPIYTVKLDSTSFFHLPSVSIDNQEYVLRLESSLTRATYKYDLPEITFTANSTYRHFTFHFHPQNRRVEQELSQGSFLILPLTLLIIFISYNYKQLLPMLTQLMGQVQAMMMGNHGGGKHGGSGSASASAPEIDPDLLMPSQPKPKARKA